MIFITSMRIEWQCAAQRRMLRSQQLRGSGGEDFGTCRKKCRGKAARFVSALERRLIPRSWLVGFVSALGLCSVAGSGEVPLPRHNGGGCAADGSGWLFQDLNNDIRAVDSGRAQCNSFGGCARQERAPVLGQYVLLPDCLINRGLNRGKVVSRELAIDGEFTGYIARLYQ